jgi:CubicO group peptidase (beta-lactamase class C family)
MKSQRFVVASLALGLWASVADAARGQESRADDGAMTDSPAAEVDRLCANWNQPGAPGVSVAVSRNGVVLYERAFGTANLELSVPLKPESVFQVASVAKQFTAMSILLLQQRGRLSIDDEVRKYLTEFPDYGAPLTVRHLLNHTSGIRDVYLLHQALAAPRDDIGDWNDVLVRRLAAQRGLNFTPGSDFQYNNGGYVLLATIVKRVSGRSLQDFAHENIFEPLGMTRTRFDDDPRRLVANRVTGYARDGEAWRRAREEITRPGSVGNSGLLSTPGDLLRWEHNFAQGTVGGQELRAAMEMPAVLTSGATLPYGLGLWVTDDRGRTTIHHGGGAPGFSAQTIRYPDHGLAIVVLANSGGFDTSGLAARISEVYIGAAQRASSTPAGPGARTVSLTLEQLAAKTGLYRAIEGPRFVRLFLRDGRLMWSRGTGTRGGLEMVPLAEGRFVIPGTAPLMFDFLPEQANALAFRASSPGQRAATFERVAPFTPSSAERRQYAGEYESSDLDVIYTIVEEGGTLHVRIPGRDESLMLEPAGRDVFQTGRGDAFTFRRDQRGDLAGFVFSSTGAWSLSFDRATR